MQIVFCNGNDKGYQRRLNHLLKDILFDFQFWSDPDLWDENYELEKVCGCRIWWIQAERLVSHEKAGHY